FQVGGDEGHALAVAAVDLRRAAGVARIDQRGDRDDVASRAAYRDVLDVLHVQAVIGTQADVDVELVAAFPEHTCAGAADAGLDGLGNLVDADAQLCHAAAVELHHLFGASFQLADVDVDDAGQDFHAGTDVLGQGLCQLQVVAAQFHLQGVVAVAAEDAVEDPEAGLGLDTYLGARDAALHALAQLVSELVGVDAALAFRLEQQFDLCLAVAHFSGVVLDIIPGQILAHQSVEFLQVGVLHG